MGPIVAQVCFQLSHKNGFHGYQTTLHAHTLSGAIFASTSEVLTSAIFERLKMRY
jgi:hypothetical protein